MKENLIILDIEEQLSADSDGTLRDELLAMLDKELATVDKKLKKGVAPSEHQDISALRDGYQATRDVLELFWQSHHEKT